MSGKIELPLSVAGGAVWDELGDEWELFDDYIYSANDSSRMVSFDLEILLGGDKHDYKMFIQGYGTKSSSYQADIKVNGTYGKGYIAGLSNNGVYSGQGGAQGSVSLTTVSSSYNMGTLAICDIKYHGRTNMTDSYGTWHFSWYTQYVDVDYNVCEAATTYWQGRHNTTDKMMEKIVFDYFRDKAFRVILFRKKEPVNVDYEFDGSY